MRPCPQFSAFLAAQPPSIQQSYQFPDDVGVSIGTPLDPQWIRLEIHYSNFHNRPGEPVERVGLRRLLRGARPPRPPHPFLGLFLATREPSPPFAPGLYDSSGIRMYYTARLRTHDMGVLQLGFFTFPIHFIPPRAESFLSYGLCKTEMFEEVTPGGKPGSPTPQPEPLTPHDCGLALRESASLGLAGVGRGPGFVIRECGAGRLARRARKDHRGLHWS